MSRRAGCARGAAALLLLAGLLLPGGAGAVPEDDIVPEAVLGVRVAARREVQDSAIDRGSREAPLINYVIPDDDLRAQVDGSIERTIHRLDLLLTYGISDTWNLSLNLPYLELEQDSTLSTASGDPEVEAALAGLESRRQSGLGDVTLTSLHRLLFSDWNAVVWGWGLIHPLGGQETPYVGVSTFDRRSPAESAFAFIHYTRFPAFPRSRFDVRVWGAMTPEDTVTLPDGTREKLKVGNQVSVRFNWSQELGPLAVGLELDLIDRRSNSLGGERQGDPVRAQVLRYHFGFGNLAALEQGPVAFPYRINVQFETPLRGSNVPEREGFTVYLQTYF